jgi:ABC-type multidrug transport system permease subunit
VTTRPEGRSARSAPPGSVAGLEHAVEAPRALFNGQWGNPEIPIGAGLMAILAVIAVWIGSRAFSRAVA